MNEAERFTRKIVLTLLKEADARQPKNQEEVGRLFKDVFARIDFDAHVIDDFPEGQDIVLNIEGDVFGPLTLVLRFGMYLVEKGILLPLDLVEQEDDGENEKKVVLN